MKWPAKNSPRSLCLYFQVHQPRRLKPFSFFDLGKSANYFDDDLNEKIIRRIARVSYLPANLMLLRLIHKYPHLRINFSISGLALEQLQRWAPAVIESFRMLAATGAVEFLGETYYHSLVSLYDEDEFTFQVKKHAASMKDLFGVTPHVFRNTELIYSDNIGRMIHELGFKGVIVDGIQALFHGQKTHHVFTHPTNNLCLLPRDFRLSDDIAFRFSDRRWEQWPLRAKDYVSKIAKLPPEDDLVLLGMDYETFGEHQPHESGIFSFLHEFLMRTASRTDMRTYSVSEVISNSVVRGKGWSHAPVSWADQARDLSAWLGNAMQRDAFKTSRKIGREVRLKGDSELMEIWRTLQASDHLYYISTKHSEDGDVHAYFSPYSSPHEAMINFMNVLSDISLRVNAPIQESTLATAR